MSTSIRDYQRLVMFAPRRTDTVYMPTTESQRVLILVQNLPVPFDRRVWLEATSLADAGYEVSVICPKMKGYNKTFERLENIDIYRYAMPIDPSTKAGFVGEVAWGLLRTFGKTIRVVLRGRGFDVIHACNPPETFWMLGYFWKPFGKRFIFDHHDLSPELFLVKFRGSKGFFYRLLMLFEKLSFVASDASIATNESHKQIAVERGGMAPEKVFVVRSGPDVNRFTRYEPDLSLKNGKKFLIAYLGEVGMQDGVDGFVRVAKGLRDVHKRSDFHCIVIGGGEQQPAMKGYAADSGVGELFTFTGVVSDDDLCRILSTADIGIDPVPKNPWSDKSTMNKIVEYMYFGLPVVAYDLKEARFSAQGAGRFAEPNSTQDYARVISELLDDPDQRERMSAFGKNRLENEISWEHSVQPLLAAYRTALGTASQADSHSTD